MDDAGKLIWHPVSPYFSPSEKYVLKDMIKIINIIAFDYFTILKSH
jgi:hypothetical protein